MRNRKIILGPAGRALRARPAGKNMGVWCDNQFKTDHTHAQSYAHTLHMRTYNHACLQLWRKLPFVESDMHNNNEWTTASVVMNCRLEDGQYSNTEMAQVNTHSTCTFSEMLFTVSACGCISSDRETCWGFWCLPQWREKKERIVAPPATPIEAFAQGPSSHDLIPTQEQHQHFWSWLTIILVRSATYTKLRSLDWKDCGCIFSRTQ